MRNILFFVFRLYIKMTSLRNILIIYIYKKKKVRVHVVQTYCDFYTGFYTTFLISFLADMSGQGSVITHLISQVKIGMDLTKVWFVYCSNA